MSQPRKHHIVTAGYVRRFTHDDVVTVHRQDGRVYDEGPAGVGYQRDFWGSPELASRIEAAFCKLESFALNVINDIQGRWPLTGNQRAALGRFLALHIVRLPAYGGFTRMLGEYAARQTIADGVVEYQMDPEEAAVYAEALRDESVHVNSLVRQMSRIASFFCSMHWSLVEFPEDWLISCDQPVVLLPYSLSPITPASAITPQGLAATLEGRFTLDPRHALLLTWHETEEATLAGTYAQACSINCALRAQTLQEWFCRAGSTPPFLSPPLAEERIYPISIELLPGYSVGSAAASKRRLAAEDLVLRMVNEQTPASKMRWVRVSEGAPA
ncbi:MAG: DUF4238 domain-containing protein [Solirubrobacteraceae bacterium]